MFIGFVVIVFRDFLLKGIFFKPKSNYNWGKCFLFFVFFPSFRLVLSVSFYLSWTYVCWLTTDSDQSWGHCWLFSCPCNTQFKSNSQNKWHNLILNRPKAFQCNNLTLSLGSALQWWLDARPSFHWLSRYLSRDSRVRARIRGCCFLAD